MYATRIIERNIDLIEKRLRTKLVRFPYKRCEEWVERLGPEAPKRALKPEEEAFIANERIMCALDFKYWAERYWTVEKDGMLGGGIGKMVLGESQEILLKAIGKAQEEEYDKVERGEIPDGILITDHKARQVWHTALMRAISMHRATLQANCRVVAGSVDDEKIQVLYERDHLGYDNLPWFLKPEKIFDEKNEHCSYSIGSKVTYMISNKKSSFGQGSQFDVGHLTELGEFDNPSRLEVDLFPAFPQSKDTLLVLESRPNGRKNWWREFTESVRVGKKARWRYFYCPWYAEPRKYRRTPPVNWQPSEIALLHAKKVYETSKEFVGKQVMLGKEQLYWWETTRSDYRESGALNGFLAQYSATPDESFQHVGESAFDAETLDELRLRARSGRPYEFSSEKEDGQTIWLPNCGGLRPMEEQELDGDSRGVVWLYEEPMHSATYYVGCDPTRGITGWSRQFRTDTDKGTDNGVVTVIRKGREGEQDKQVAEYAAPIDPEDLADVVNLLGRTYCGSNEEGQAMVNLEVWPGPGEPTLRKLLTTHGYMNLYTAPKYANSVVPEYGKNTMGWISNARSRRELWRRGMKHVALRKIRLFSPDLVEEMADCESDDWMYTDTARAKYGKHDDRVVTLFLAIYCAHDWGDEVESKKVEVQTDSNANWQACAITSEAMMDEWNERFAQIMEGSL